MSAFVLIRYLASILIYSSWHRFRSKCFNDNGNLSRDLLNTCPNFKYSTESGNLSIGWLKSRPKISSNIELGK